MSSHCQLENDSHEIVLESYPDFDFGNNVVFLLYNSDTLIKSVQLFTAQDSRHKTADASLPSSIYE